MSIDFNLDNEVISDFVSSYTFQRPTASIVNGRETKTFTNISISAYIHPDNNQSTNDIQRQGYHYEQFVKIFSSRNENILKDDEFVYNNQRWRVLENNSKLVGSYTKYKAGLLGDWLQTYNYKLYKIKT